MTPMGQNELPQLKIHILGSPEVSLNGQLIRINRRELRAGLFFLAGHSDPLNRSEICDIFWPKDTETASRKKLREGLSRLRSVLLDPDFIVTNNETVGLNANRVYVDYREYLQKILPLVSSSEMNSDGKLPQ